MLAVGGTFVLPKAESAPGVHGNGSSQVSFTPVPSAASASLTGCQICNLEITNYGTGKDVGVWQKSGLPSAGSSV